MSFWYRDLHKDDLYDNTGLSNRFDRTPLYPEIEVTSDPTIDFVSLAFTKNEQRVRHSEDDNLLQGYVDQAVKDVERFTGRAIGTQEITVYWKLVYDYVWLPRPPLQSITSVTEIDDDGNETTITSSEYDVFGNKEIKIEFDNVINNQLKVVFQAGYGNTVSDIPQWAKSAVQWQTKLYYDKNTDLAIDAASGLAMPAYLACKDERYYLPE